MVPQVLQLDMQGTPQAWISLQDAAAHYACDAVVWCDGQSPLATLRGGFNVARGVQSVLDIHPIIAVRGVPKLNLFDVTPSFSKAKLLKRDRHTCAYCGQVFAERLRCLQWPQSRQNARRSAHALAVPALHAQPV
jgi:ribosomal protein L37E